MEFVTDRTEADVLLGNKKGRYSYTDLNRVETAVCELCNLAEQLGVQMDITTKTDWGPPETFPDSGWITQSHAERYLHNVKALCDRFAVKLTYPETLINLDYRGANAIEQALKRVYQNINTIPKVLHYSGELFAGEENIL